MSKLRFFSAFLLLVTAVFSIYGCGRGSKITPHPPTGALVFDPAIHPEYQALIREDLAYFESFQIKQPAPDLLEFLHLPNASSQSFLSWLYDGVHYFVAEQFQPAGNSFIEEENFNYPLAGIFPDLDGGDETAINRAELGNVLVSNLGSALYLQGKINRSLLSMDFPNYGRILIDSPMIGLLQIGTGLFNTVPLFKTPISELEHRLFRISIYFHERQHSSGSGASLGFFHNMCPMGHTYAGHDVCDRSLNGAYRTGALALKSLIDSSKELSAPARHGINVIMADALDRVLPLWNMNLGFLNYHQSASFYWNDTPERVSRK